MTQLPTNRTETNTVAEHVADHNTLAAEHNELDGHVADTSVHGIADTAALVLTGDARLSDTRTPSALSVTNAMVSATAAIAKSKLAALAIVNADVDAAAAIVESKLSLASDAAAGTASRRTLGTGATQAAAGDHAHSGTYVALSTIDAPGDLLVGTANDTVGRLAMGAALTVLRVNAGATALEFAAPAAAGDMTFARFAFR